MAPEIFKTRPITEIERNYHLRLTSFINDVRVKLADDNWHYILSNDIAAAHNVNAISLGLLVTMGCIEKRPSRANGRRSDYRRLPALAALTVLEFAREKSKHEKVKERATTEPQPPLVQTTAVNSGPANAMPTPQAPAPEPVRDQAPQYLLLKSRN